MTTTLSRTPTVIAIAFAATAVLTGCTRIGDVALHRSSSHADTRADLQFAPDWLPDDATDITSVSGSTDSEGDVQATTVFTSQRGVTDPACATRTRNSAPTLPVMGAPDVYPATTILQCGAWSMTNDGDRWVAWTPNPGDRPTSAEVGGPTDAPSRS